MVGDIIEVRERFLLNNAVGYVFHHFKEAAGFAAWTWPASDKTRVWGGYILFPIPVVMAYRIKMQVRLTWVRGVEAGRVDEYPEFDNVTNTGITIDAPPNVSPVAVFSGVSPTSGITRTRRLYPFQCAAGQYRQWSVEPSVTGRSIVQSQVDRMLLPVAQYGLGQNFGQWGIFSRKYDDFAPYQSVTVLPYLSTQRRRRANRP